MQSMNPRSLSLFAALAIVASTVAAAEPKSPTVNVSGRGIVRAAPDQVILQLKMKTSDDDLIRVRKTNETQARTLQELAKKNGVDEAGFEVSRLDLSLSYNDQLRRQIYALERDITVRLNDLSKLDSLLAGLLVERDVKIASISFVHSKAKQFELEARKLAVAEAREKATQLAELNGYNLGKALDIDIVSEGFRPFVTSVIPVVGSGQGFGGGGFDGGFSGGGFGGGFDDGTTARVKNVVQVDENGEKVVEKSLSLGIIETSASVNITFSLND